MGKLAMEGKHFTTSHLVSVASRNPSSHTFPSSSSFTLMLIVIAGVDQIIDIEVDRYL